MKKTDIGNGVVRYQYGWFIHDGEEVEAGCRTQLPHLNEEFLRLILAYVTANDMDFPLAIKRLALDAKEIAVNIHPEYEAEKKADEAEHWAKYEARAEESARKVAAKLAAETPPPKPAFRIIRYLRPTIPNELRKVVYERDGYRCVKCGSQNKIACDHIHPVSKGGETSLENLQVLCSACNGSKATRSEPPSFTTATFAKQVANGHHE